jgi:hypothetical protein
MYPTLSLFIIDGIGPFFQGNRREEINWSKIDFSDLDSDGSIPEERIRRIEEGFHVFARRAAAMGYNAVTLDDLAHLVSHSFYSEALQKKIEQYRDLYRSLFAIAAGAGLRVFITTDLLFFNEAIEKTIGNNPQKLRKFTADCCRIFFESDHRKLVELQTRREYEGFGQFPSFIGHDYEKLRKELTFARNMAGISVWCQTGGWSGFRRLTLLEDSGIWNEINTYVTLRIFRDRLSSDRSVQAFCNEHLNRIHWQPLKELLDLSDRVIKNLLYIDEFATRRIFFRRLRMPPLIAVYWKHILISHLMRKIMHCYVSRSYGRELTRTGCRTLRDIRRMRQLAGDLGLPQEDFDFQYDTFRIIAAARAYYFLDHPDRTLKLLHKMKIRYEAKWPEPRYAVRIDIKPFPLRSLHFRRIIHLLFRRRSGYRAMDRLLALTLYSILQPLVRRINRRIFPDFTQNQAMGIDSVFK